MTTVYPQEAWCPRCQVSHTPGTKVCMHCGGRVQPTRHATMRGAPQPATAPSPFETLPAEAGAEEETEARAARPLRLGMAVLWIVMAIVAAVMRACQGGP